MFTLNRGTPGPAEVRAANNPRGRGGDGARERGNEAAAVAGIDARCGLRFFLIARWERPLPIVVKLNGTNRYMEKSCVDSRASTDHQTRVIHR